MSAVTEPKPPPPPGQGPPPVDNDAMLAFVLGVVSMAACQVLGPVALFIGYSYYRRCKDAGVEPNVLGVVGMALGGVSTIVLVILLLLLCLYVAFFVVFFVVYIAFFAFVFLLAILSAAAGA